MKILKRVLGTFLLCQFFPLIAIFYGWAVVHETNYWIPYLVGWVCNIGALLLIGFIFLVFWLLGILD